MVVMHDGAPWGCGWGVYGQLGVGDRANRLTLVRVGSEEGFGQSGVLMVGCGNAHTVAVTDEGRLWLLGKGAQGRRLVPVKVEVEGLNGAKIVSAACGGAHSAR
jgi:hypothetical protein